MREAPCHPERRYFAKDRCRSCYQAHRLHVSPEYKKKQAALATIRRGRLKHKEYQRRWYLQQRIPARRGPCEVCADVGVLCWDHDHATGQFRGWLCRQCNSVLGFVEDSTERLAKLILYLQRDFSSAPHVPRPRRTRAGGTEVRKLG